MNDSCIVLTRQLIYLIKVPVYDLLISGDHVMRRRSDDWINATHILKLAGYDKPARTRILEREVQKGVHEKIQGGYGKYQGQPCV
jgi:transcription factor MBP1